MAKIHATKIDITNKTVHDFYLPILANDYYVTRNASNSMNDLINSIDDEVTRGWTNE
jgi:hypothetical protein